MLQHDRIKIDELPQAFRQAIRDAANHRTGEAVADEDDVIDLLGHYDRADIVDAGRQPRVGPQQVRALTQPRHRRREHLVAVRPQVRSHLPPTPAAMPCTMDKHKTHRISRLT